MCRSVARLSHEVDAFPLLPAQTALVRAPRAHRRRPLINASRSTVASTAAGALAGQLAVYLAAFVNSILIARAVGAEGRGLYYVPVLAASMAVAVASLGVESASAVAFSERRVELRRLARMAGALALILGPIAALLTLAAFALFRSSAFEGVTWSSVLIVAATIPISLHQLWLVNVFLLAKRLSSAQVALVAGAVVQVGAGTALYAAGRLGVQEVLLLYVAGLVVAWSIMLVRARGFTTLRPALDVSLTRSVVAFGAKVHVGLLLSFLVLRFDVFLVNSYLGPADVGAYTIAVVFAELAWLLTNPLVQAAIPFQAELSLRDSAALAFKACRFNLVIASAVAVVFAATLWFAIPLVYGNEFSDAYGALVLLLPGIVAMAACRPVGLVIARQMRPLRYTAVGLAAFALNCALNVVLLPVVGIPGAAIASTAAYGLTAVALIIWAARIGDRPVREFLAYDASDLQTLRRAAQQARDAWPGGDGAKKR